MKDAAWFSLAELPGEPLLSFLFFLLEPQEPRSEGRSAYVSLASSPQLSGRLQGFLPSLWLFSPSVYLSLSLPLSLLRPLSYIRHSVIIGQCESMKNESGIVAALMEPIDQRKRRRSYSSMIGSLLQAATQTISQAVWIERERRTLRKPMVHLHRSRSTFALPSCLAPMWS